MLMVLFLFLKNKHIHINAEKLCSLCVCLLCSDLDFERFRATVDEVSSHAQGGWSKVIKNTQHTDAHKALLRPLGCFHRIVNVSVLHFLTLCFSV